VCIAYIVIPSFFERNLYEYLADGETVPPVEMSGLIRPFNGLRMVKIFEFQYEPIL
jgi:hypothetical protein